MLYFSKAMQNYVLFAKVPNVLLVFLGKAAKKMPNLFIISKVCIFAGLYAVNVAAVLFLLGFYLFSLSCFFCRF